MRRRPRHGIRRTNGQPQRQPVIEYAFDAEPQRIVWSRHVRPAPRQIVRHVS
jgi:hypothetical protein